MLVVGILGSPKQTKESARRGASLSAICFYYAALGHMFLLCGAGPYVCIGWLWAWGSAICFYYAALGYMLVLVGCRRGAGPYLSIVCVYVFVCMIICMCVYICVSVFMDVCVSLFEYVCVSVCVCLYVSMGFHHLWEGYCRRYTRSSN